MVVSGSLGHLFQAFTEELVILGSKQWSVLSGGISQSRPVNLPLLFILERQVTSVSLACVVDIATCSRLYLVLV